MSFTLTVDAGNTKVKCALYDSHKNALSFFLYEDLEKIIKNFNLNSKNTNAIISNVTNNEIDLPFNSLNIDSLFKDGNFLDMKVDYNKTVGLDRLAISYYQFKTQNLPCLLIDTGTFTTIDTISTLGFEGGYILPGLNIIEESFLKGAKLPKAVAHFESLYETPKTTIDAVAKGASLAFLCPIEKLINKSNSQTIVITGGNAKFVVDNLSKSTSSPLQVEENLIHKALFFIKNMVQ